MEIPLTFRHVLIVTRRWCGICVTDPTPLWERPCCYISGKNKMRGKKNGLKTTEKYIENTKLDHSKFTSILAPTAATSDPTYIITSKSFCLVYLSSLFLNLDNPPASTGSIDHFHQSASFCLFQIWLLKALWSLFAISRDTVSNSQALHVSTNSSQIRLLLCQSSSLTWEELHTFLR